MTERFIKGYCCGDVGLVDKEKEEWFVENINSISDSERNWNDVLDKLNGVAEENEQLQHKLSQQEMEYATDLHRLSEENEQLKKDCTVLICHNQEYRKENEQLQHKLSQQEMEYVTTAHRQAEENEELKDRIDNYNTAFKKLQDLTERKINENEQLKQNIGIILKYCREKGKYAMDMKETKAHNVLQRILNEGDDGDD